MLKGRPLRVWCLIHVGILAFLLLFPLYVRLAKSISPIFSGCLLHDYLFLYCPMCGGTRAVEALLHLEFAKAIAYNPMVIFGGAAAFILDGVALIRILKKKKQILVIPGWTWIACTVIFLLFGVVRNYLMIRHGYDPLGDLGAIWQILNP